MADDQIQVQITADTSQFEAAMANAAAAAQASFDKIKQAADGATSSINGAGQQNRTAGQAGERANQEWGKSFSNLQGTINSSITGMIMGTTTWQKAVQKLTQTALKDFLTATEKSAESWLVSELTKTGSTEAGVAARTEVENAGQSAGLSDMLMSALKEISTSAATAAAKAYAAVSGIPYVGPILAPAAAAAAFAAVLAFGGKLPSSAGGLWNVPSDTMAFIHKQETILPAHIAQPMRDFFTGGGATAGGGGNFAVTIQAIDTQTGAQFLMNNAGTIAQGLAREMRNGNSALRSALK
ncbi:MAG TPA: hypothetical protein VG328_05030 [Stellaceae bacterium]|jgi:hypothetical protein|nr:hypothetical protein [Stellaceae bacterium]